MPASPSAPPTSNPSSISPPPPPHPPPPISPSLPAPAATTTPAQQEAFQSMVSVPQPSATPPQRSQLTRDDRIRVQLLRDIGWNYMNIAKQLKCTSRQVQYACTHSSTPSKRPGRPSKFSKVQRDVIEQVIQYVEERAPGGSRVPLKRLMQILKIECKERILRRELEKRGYRCGETSIRPPGPLEAGEVRGQTPSVPRAEVNY